VFSSNLQYVVGPFVGPSYVPGRLLPEESAAVEVVAADAASSSR
jgi:hypothetical protein